MRLLFTIINVLLLLNALFSQDLSQAEKRLIRENVFTLLTAYNNSADFRELGGSTLSNAEMVDFAQLFTEDATIFDPINPDRVFDEEGVGFYQLKERTVQEYIDGITQNFPNALEVKITNVYLDFDSAAFGRVRVLIEKMTIGEHLSYRGRFSNVDTSLLVLALGEDFKEARIAKAVEIGSNLTVQNDRDQDGILNEQDRCPDEPGVLPSGCPPKDRIVDTDKDGVPDKQDECPEEKGFRPHGCPDTDGDRFADHIDECLKIPGRCRGCPCPDLPPNQLNVWVSGSSNKIDFGTTDLFPLGYESLVTQRSSYSTPTFDSTGAAFRFGIGAEWDLYPFEKRKVGISLGAHYQGYSSSAVMSEFKAEYQSQDAVGDTYRRILTIRDINEEFKVGYLTIPVLLKVRYPLPSNEDLILFVHAGPALSFQLGNSGTSTAIGDFEAVYTYTDRFEFDPNQEDWALTRERIQELAGSEQAVMEYFESRGALFDIALDEELESSPSLEQTMGIGGLLRAGVTYCLNEQWFLNIGGQLFFSRIGSRAGSSFMLSDKVGELNSLFSGLDYKKAKLSHVGLSIGLAYGLNQKN